MMAHRILIIEDEPIVVDRLIRMIGRSVLPAPINFVTATSLKQARLALTEVTHDLAFLDLNLVGADGFDLVRACVLEARSTIVVSANTDRALEAFELGVVDFVPKPFDQARLDLAISRAEAARDVRDVPRYLAVQGRGVIEPVSLTAIKYVRAAGNYAELVLCDGSVRLYEQTMDKLEAALPRRFMRIHRSHIVDTSLIARIEIHEGSRYECVLADETKLPVGRTRISALRDQMGRS
jgi:DNA-binding LytR/AlgR family response regulator